MAQQWPRDEQDSNQPAVVVRPAIPWRRYAVFGTIFLLAIALTAVGCIVLITDTMERNVAIGTCLAIVTLIVLGGVQLVLVSRLSSLGVDHESLVATNALGIRRRIDRGRLTRIQGASFDVSIRGSYTMRHWLFLDREGWTLLKLPQKWWPDDAVETLGQALALPIERSQEVLSGADFRRVYPGAIPWFMAHPRLASSIMGLSIFLAIIAVLMLLSLAQGAS